jgi:uncharacterized protein (DUF1499 family)
MNRSIPMLAVTVLAAALVAGALLLVAGPGYRAGWWALGPAFTLMRWAAWLGTGVAAAAVIVAGLLAWRGPRRFLAHAGLALLLALVTAAVPAWWRAQARSVPPIHDITTDTEHPPEFVAIAPLRADAPNPVAYPGEAVAAQQQAAYPDLEPIVLAADPEQVFAAARASVRDLGWELVAAEPVEGRIEATDRTFWFGFVDDVVIRIREHNDGTRVDVRSKSRVGGSDIGTNAKRIRGFRQRLLAALETA